MRVLLDLLLPPACPGCGREGDVLCDSCVTPFRRRMGEPAGSPIGLPSDLPDGVLQLEWCAAFTGSVRAAVHALKYGGERRLVEPLATLMAERWRSTSRGGDLLVPVPVHAARRRERGFDQAEELARVVGRILGIEVSMCLARQQRTTAQHSLGRSERARNVGHAFAIAPRATSVNDRWVVLVDDVMTTGATLRGCAGVLREAGARGVSALTLARER